MRGTELSPSAEQNKAGAETKYFSCTECFEGGESSVPSRHAPAPEKFQSMKSYAQNKNRQKQDKGQG